MDTFMGCFWSLMKLICKMLSPECSLVIILIVLLPKSRVLNGPKRFLSKLQTYTCAENYHRRCEEGRRAKKTAIGKITLERLASQYDRVCVCVCVCM